MLLVTVYLVGAFGETALETTNTPEANLSGSEWYYEPHARDVYCYGCTFPANSLNDERYSISVLVRSPNPATEELRAHQVVSFDVVETGAMRSLGLMGKWQGVVRVPLEWHGDLVRERL